MTARRILAAVWDFIVGDDWRVALGIVAMLAVTALIAALGVRAWWLGPSATVAVLYFVRAPRRATSAAPGLRPQTAPVPPISAGSPGSPSSGFEPLRRRLTKK